MDGNKWNRYYKSTQLPTSCRQKLRAVFLAQHHDTWFFTIWVTLWWRLSVMLRKVSFCRRPVRLCKDLAMDSRRFFKWASSSRATSTTAVSVFQQQQVCFASWERFYAKNFQEADFFGGAANDSYLNKEFHIVEKNKNNIWCGGDCARPTSFLPHGPLQSQALRPEMSWSPCQPVQGEGQSSAPPTGLRRSLRRQGCPSPAHCSPVMEL